MNKRKFIVKRKYFLSSKNRAILYLTPGYEETDKNTGIAVVEYMSEKQKRIEIKQGKVVSISTPSRYQAFCPYCQSDLRIKR